MGGLASLTRRGLLIGSSAILGGVAFGTYRYLRDPDNPLETMERPEKSAVLTPYILIDADKITLVTPRLDMGQGAKMTQALLLAEELDVTLDQVELIHGPPSLAYYNQVIAAENIPIPSTSSGFRATLAERGADIAGKLAALHVTGGSSTSRDGYEKLRLAGAVARETLKEVAARSWGTARNALNTKNGLVIAPDGRSMRYQELAEFAAGLDPIKTDTLKPRARWSKLGKLQTRVDIRSKSTGAALFGIDRQLPNMAYATLRTDPHGRALRSYDVGKAETMRGVRQILPITGGVGVIADNTWRAFRAMEQITFDWEKGTLPQTQDAVTQTLFESFKDKHIDSTLRRDGDVDAYFAGSASAAVTYSVPFLLHGALEPLSVTAWIAEDVVHIWTATQVPLVLRDAVADLLDYDPKSVHVHVEDAGGSFGRRLEIDHVLSAVKLARHVDGVPLKVTWTREEDSRCDRPRPALVARGMADARNGSITAFDLNIAGPSANAAYAKRLGYPSAGADVGLVSGAWDQPFEIENYRVAGYRTQGLFDTGIWRSTGASAGAFFHESLLDEVMAREGFDPIEQRLRLCRDTPSRTVIEAVADLSSWGRALRPGEGRGVAFCVSFGTPAAVVIDLIAQGQEIKITHIYGVANLGVVLDPATCHAQMTGGSLFGLDHALYGGVRYENALPEAVNFDQMDRLRLETCPAVTMQALELGDEINGIGEPMVPPIAPALGNAIYAATSQRVRHLPFSQGFEFI